MFKELRVVEKLLEYSHPLVKHEVLGHVTSSNQCLPIHSFVIGNDSASVPTLGLFAGVHGIEKIGTHVVANYLEKLFIELSWNEDLMEELSNFRIVAIPLINPGGMFLNKRSNPNGVDLMRNSPTIVEDGEKTFFLSGHKISNALPWYQGDSGKEMELELQLLISFVKKYIFTSPVSFSIDFHSGFGMQDRLWFPYGKTRRNFKDYDLVMRVKQLFDKSFSFHRYIIEPQSTWYLIEGDVWDHIYDEYQKLKSEEAVYIPWTIEMGSWSWVRKNPRQILTFEGLFNPIKNHRYERAMRRHFILIDYFYKFIRNKEAWAK